MPIGLKIYTPSKGGFGVYVCSLSGMELAWLIEHKCVRHVNGDETLISCVSDRLTHKKSKQGARNWIARFKQLGEIEQLAMIADRYLRKCSSEYVVKKIQYYQLVINGVDMKSSPLIHELEKYANKLGIDYSIKPTVAREWKIPVDWWERHKENVHEVTSARPSVEYKGFTNKVSKQVKSRVINSFGRVSDRHPGFAITTSPNFRK